ncbi:MAG: 1-deoxy-D-xylulose-5-phosphate synthase [Bacillota bacterium]|nr:1-deoxy-D-xylulose-5-phosphate synthase [Bacillota bacterium]
MYPLLSKIECPADVKKLSDQELTELAAELRSFMVHNVADTGGHLAPSLGVVELILALCAEYDFPTDKVIFDVGHQSYAYKILTGRRDNFSTLRQWQGLSGFPKGSESPYDYFDTGHSSTSLSAGFGMAVARDLKGETFEIVSIIGDGALTGGMAYEAMNNVGSYQKDMVVVLNDNAMSISPNVGGMANYLNRVRTAPNYEKSKRDLEKMLTRSKHGTRLFRGLRRLKDSFKYLIVDGIIFEELGFTYLGPIDGHDIPTLRQYLRSARAMNGPVFVHVHTKKGKGYIPSESYPHIFHGIAPFDPDTGKVKKNGGGFSFSSSFGQHLLDMASSDNRICAITAAMPDGTGLKEFASVFPNRFFDVGIAEQHAVTFGAGLAKEGMIPAVAIYSSFLQRGFDQVFHDVCLQNLPVIFGVDRSGVVGEDGETHQGIYDISFLRALPNITIMAPSTDKEVKAMLRFAKELGTPCALRYPRGSVLDWDVDLDTAPVEMAKGELIREGEDILFIPLGIMIKEAIGAAEVLEKHGVKAAVFNPRFIKPLDKENLRYLGKKYKNIITVEDHVREGGFGSAILEFFADEGITSQVTVLGYPDVPIKHGHRDIILSEYGLSLDALTLKALEVLAQ